MMALTLLRQSRPFVTSHSHGTCFTSKFQLSTAIKAEVSKVKYSSMKPLSALAYQYGRQHYWSNPNHKIGCIRMSWPSTPSRSKSLSTCQPPTSADGSKCRQFYNGECEDAINQQINQEFQASMVYWSMAYYFDRDDVALKGFHEFFRKSALEELKHAEMFMKYQNTRGGRIQLNTVSKPDKAEWKSPVEAIRDALALEKRINLSLKEIHVLATKHEDYQLENYIEQHMDEQVATMKKLADYWTTLVRTGFGLGEYMFDKMELPKPSDGSTSDELKF